MATGARRRATRPARVRRTASWFEPVESKLHVPVPRRELVPRARLLEQLSAAHDSPLILVTAPPGYGKTTMLAQWGERDARPFAWVTLDDTDNDASRLLTYVIFALDQVVPLGGAIFPSPPEPGPSFTAFSLPRLTRALAKRVRPFVLVIDDVHVLTDRASLDLLAMLVEQVPSGCHVVLVGRDQPALPLSRLVANRSLVRFGAVNLAMTPLEGLELMHADGVPLGDAEAAMIVDRTEGWPAGLHLAALALREQEHLGKALETFAGTDALITEYLRAELLERLSPERRTFMMKTAALDRLSGPLCDAVLRTTGSGEKLEDIERANIFVAATDRNHKWYRRHQLFREMLLAELRRRDPKHERVQHRRAAEWFASTGNPDAALKHARAAGDIELAARIICSNVQEYLSSGRAATIRQWIEDLPSRELAEIPSVGPSAALVYIANGDVERALHWLHVAERSAEASDDGPLPDGRASLRSGLALSRAALGMGGAVQLAEDAETGYGLEPEGSPWRAFAAFLHGVALHLQGKAEDATAKLQEAADATAFETPNVYAFSLAYLALCAAGRGDWDDVREKSERARMEVERNGLHEYASASIVYAVSALSCAHSRQPAEARRDAMRANRLLATLSGVGRWMGVEGRVVLAETYLFLGDVAAARESLRDAQRDLSHLPDAPALRDRFDEAHREVIERYETGASPALTAAEIRVMQFLPTHLSFREIADRLHVSRNTVKTQVISAYRKLGVANRTEAVESARNRAVIGD
jgi:LuxR family maltose regulon positive regulatory protein